eukprot:GHVQ01013410.1.p1 GENE.GHVQ01013410.1~~GHVQ01013410.1.p1  ORF type:complete len:426 (+),score=26.97 GHVQ01013410.1:2014-3291(+)
MTQKYRGALSMWADSRRMRWHLVSLLSNLPNAFASQHHPGVGESGGPKALIFVLDSGANCDHPDSPKWYRNPDGSCGFVFGENPPRMSDEQGHGTPIAGIIGMRVNNGVGGRGIAPDTEIVPMKLYSNTSGAPQFTVTAAINKIFDMKRDEKYEGVTFIVNLSQGSFSATPTLDGLFLKAQALGILFVVSAGNEKTDLSKITRSPCSLAEILDNTTCVASTSREDELTTSNYDSSKRKIVTVGAPGVEILSMYGNNGYRFLNGSSFATPLVAGIYALGFNVNPGMGIKEAKLLLMKTSKDVPGLHGKVASGGVVNAEAFVRNASLGGGYMSLTCHSKSFELQAGEAKSQEYIFNGIESGILKADLTLLLKNLRTNEVSSFIHPIAIDITSPTPAAPERLPHNAIENFEEDPCDDIGPWYPVTTPE